MIIILTYRTPCFTACGIRIIFSGQIICLIYSMSNKRFYPKVKKPGTKVGQLTQQVALKTGFAAGTPLVVGAGDQNAAALGAGIVTPGIASVSIGTGGMSTVMVEKPFR